MTTEILRDDWGIPHVWADTAVDALYGQGRACALDRAWQLEFMRLRAEGRTAEAFGVAGVGWDVFARRSGMARAAVAIYAASSARTRTLLDAYVRGVNSALDGSSALAPELSALAHRPDPWQPWTPIAVFLMHNILFGRFPTKMWRTHACRELGPTALTLFDFESQDGPGADAPTPASDEFIAELLAELRIDGPQPDPGNVTIASSDSGDSPDDAGAMGHALSGSNAWGVSASRSATGVPIVAGDPHRFLELPGVYQQIHLGCQDFDVVGLAFVGVPGMPHFSHTGEVAWGITNAMADYQDLYVERLSRTGGDVYAETPTGPGQVTAWTEIIGVRDGDGVSVEIIVTANGAVVFGGPDDDFAISLRSPMLTDPAMTFDTPLDLLYAKTIGDVEEAFTSWAEPVNRLIVADRDGGVSQHVVGVLPRRSDENYWLPVPGWEQRFQWHGYHGASVDNSGFDAAVTDVAVHANQRTANCSPLQPLSTECVVPGRANRLTELLNSLDEVSVEDCRAMHADVRLDEAHVVIDAVAAADGLSVGAQRIRARLYAWDRLMTAESTDAYLFAEVRTQLVREIARRTSLRALAGPHDFPAVFSPWLMAEPRIGAALARVLDQAELYAIDLAAVAAAALEATAEATAGGTEVPTWGSHHVFAPIHGFDLVGRSADYPTLLGQLRPHTTELAGDGECVMANSSAIGFTHHCRLGSTARYVWDLAERDKSHWVVPMGASGDPRSAHFQDQLPRWAVGDTVPVIIDWNRLRAFSGEEPSPTAAAPTSQMKGDVA